MGRGVDMEGMCLVEVIKGYWGYFGTAGVALMILTYGMVGQVRSIMCSDRPYRWTICQYVVIGLLTLVSGLIGFIVWGLAFVAWMKHLQSAKLQLYGEPDGDSQVVITESGDQ